VETLKRWYVIVAVLVFTFCVNIYGHTPAGWVLTGVSYVIQHAPRMGSIGS